MSEVKITGCITPVCTGNRVVYREGEAPKIYLPGDLLRELDAQRLRADTAEAELKNVRKSRADELENYNALISDHAAAEQRIADTVAKLQMAADMLDDDERGNRFAQVLQLAIAALNQKSEGESQ